MFKKKKLLLINTIFYIFIHVHVIIPLWFYIMLFSYVTFNIRQSYVTDWTGLTKLPVGGFLPGKNKLEIRTNFFLEKDKSVKNMEFSHD